MTTTLAPGINLPSLPHSPESPDLWFYEVTGEADGTLTVVAYGDPERTTKGYTHVATFPTWSEGRIGFFQIETGRTVRVHAAAENTLAVTIPGGQVQFPGQILILAHADIPETVLKAYYQESK